MKKISTAMLLWLWIAVGYGQSDKAFISGKIWEAPGKPLQGAYLTLFDWQDGADDHPVRYAMSRNDGSYAFDAIERGYYVVKITCIGYAPVSDTLLVLGGARMSKDYSMQEVPFPLQQVMVTSLRRDIPLKSVTVPMVLVTSHEIERNPAITVPDMLRNEPGISLVRDGIWATSISIRGLSDQRIITLVDGNRLETATDVAGGLAMIDLGDVERIEVIKGAGSTLYGSGGLGGAVNIITKGGYFSDAPYFNGNASTGYESVNSQFNQSLMLRAGSANWYLKVGGMFRNAGNTMTPDGILPNSQYHDNNLSATLGIKLSEKRDFRLDLQQFTARDVGIPGGRSFPASATAIYPVEKRQMLSANYTIKNIGDNLDKISIKYYIQYILRDVDLKPSSTVDIQPIGKHLTNGFQVQSDWKFGARHNFIAGFEMWQRNLETSREKTVTTPVTDSIGNVVGQNVTVRGEVPIPTSTFTDFGFYFQDAWSLVPEKLSLTLGTRIDFINVTNQQALDPIYLIVNGVRNDNPANQRITFNAANKNAISWSASAGLLYSLNSNMNLTLDLARSFRAPSLEERFKYIDLGALVHIGDPNLKPEDGYFGDLGLKIFTDHLYANVDVYINRLNNEIMEKPGIFTYSYTDKPNQTDTLPAYILTNVDKSLLYGFDTRVEGKFGHFRAYTKLGFVRGLDLLAKENLPLIPPFNGEAGIGYDLPGKLGVLFSTFGAIKQEKAAPAESQTPGYMAYNLQMNSAMINLKVVRLQFFAGIDNMFDSNYMLFLSSNRGIVKSEPGRNVYVRMNVRW